MMKKFKLLGLLTLIMITSVMMVACREKKIAFDNKIVIVVLSSEWASLDKEWTPADFPGFAFSKVESGFWSGEIYVKYSGGILFFYLAEPSRKNVLKAINYLNTRPEIESASPNSAMYLIA